MGHGSASRALRRRWLRHEERAHRGLRARFAHELRRTGLPLLAALLLPAGAAAQSELWADALTGISRPPLPLDTLPGSVYGMLGARWRFAGDTDYDAGLAFQAGFGTDTAAGDWYAGAATWAGLFPRERLSWLIDVTAEGAAFREPVDYGIVIASLRPGVVADVGGRDVTARIRLEAGRWESGMRSGAVRVAGITAALDGFASGWEYWAEVEALRARNGVLAGALDGVFAGISGGMAVTVAGVWIDAEATAWRTPMRRELGWRLGLARALRESVWLTADVGRSVTDPAYGSAPSLTASLGLSVRVSRRASGAPQPVVRLLEGGSHGTVARFTVQAPGASEVALAGDFTGWQPRPMKRDGDGWVAQVELPAGLHHFAFLVDGHWYVPPGAPGLSSDGFGWQNASIVVPHR